MISKKNCTAQTKGIIFGLAIGDALGWPTEFISLSQIKFRYGNSGITDLPDPALFTDDIQMSIAIAEASSVIHLNLKGAEG